MERGAREENSDTSGTVRACRSSRRVKALRRDIDGSSVRGAAPGALRIRDRMTRRSRNFRLRAPRG
ncbi:hypothetical protein WT15_24940 [Burkholderia stagnalis]|nr:hypothetical protein WT74_01080 [Burkholderia stagnalis]KVM85799.1 hypothetical protein WT05_14390 [Burkholderia stagnalis]KVN73447.1 hypothetical protein WT15_24940 [Burkholderia stagnalis]KWO32761.1 hypothetical protein WT95_13985 [Burkholderia stagnalis]KWO33662.1 hypothetical protein WT96_20705 [Burkholderia stagnalis]